MINKQVCTNGIRIVSEHMPHVRSVSVGVWIEAGSADETNEEAGIAHFIEHMLFKGTATRTARTIAEEFDRIGGDLNAFTSKDMTCFYATVLSEHAKKALTILEDMIFHSKFDEVEIEKEKSVVLEEIAIVEDTPDDDVHEQLWSTMYPNNSIGRPILGNKETINLFSKKSMLNFINRLYIPERIIISVAGNIDDNLINFIEKLFGLFKSAPKPSLEISAQPPLFYPGLLVKEKSVEQVHMCLGFPGLILKDERMYDLVIVDSIIGSSMSSRLFQEVREEKGLAYSIYSYYTSYVAAGSFVIYGGTSPEKMNELYNTIDSIINTILVESVTNREIQNAKEHVIGGFLLGLESTEARMFRNGKNELMFEPHKSAEEVVARIQDVKKASVHQVANTIFTKERAISIIAPKESVDSIQFI